MVSLSNHERLAQDVLVEPRAVGRPSAFAEATADRRSAKREGWSTSSGRAVRQFNCSPGLMTKTAFKIDAGRPFGRLTDFATHSNLMTDDHTQNTNFSSAVF